MDVLRIIDTLNANSNVGRVQIRLNSNHKWNSEIIILITNRYNNVYDIEVWDSNESVDHQMHNLIKQYV